ncbi:MAG: GTP cyclohydrolase I [Gammaproteobacteria bacterium]|jgi:GTP cyclohydrolase I
MSANPVSIANDIEHTLGAEARLVRNALIEQGLETPMIDTGLSSQQKYQRIKHLMSEVVETLGLDLHDDSLAETPHRIAKMYVSEIFSGLDYSTFPRLSLIDNKLGESEMIRVSDISLISTCEHHFVTIDGIAKVAYVPRGKIVGLSKINRLVRFFAQRPQIQERLTRQIQVAMQAVLGTDDVAVAIDATHYCVKSRGVMDSGSRTTTSAMGGSFKTDASARAEFLGR